MPLSPMKYTVHPAQLQVQLQSSNPSVVKSGDTIMIRVDTCQDSVDTSHSVKRAQGAWLWKACIGLDLKPALPTFTETVSAYGVHGG